MTMLIFGPQIGSLIASQVGLGEVFKIAWNILRWPVIVFLLVNAEIEHVSARDKESGEKEAPEDTCWYCQHRGRAGTLFAPLL